VETQFGWHLIKVEDVHEGRVKAFEDADVQADLLQAYRAKDAEHRFRELSEKLEQAAFESPNSLDAAAKAVGIAVQTSDWFTRSAGTGIAEKVPVRDAAFADEVLKSGENSKPVSIGENHVVVVRKQEYEAAKQRPLAEVADAIKQELKDETGRERATKEAAAALEAIAAGKPLEQVVTDKHAKLEAPGLVKRDATGIDTRILEALFKLPRPPAGKSSHSQVALANGSVAVIVTTAVNDAEWTAAAADEQKKEASKLRESSAGAEFAAYRADVEKRLEVKIVNPPQGDADPTS